MFNNIYLADNLEWSLFLSALNSFKCVTNIGSEIFELEDKSKIKTKALKIANNILKKITHEEYENEFYNKINKLKNFKLSQTQAEEFDFIKGQVLKSGNNDESDMSNIILFNVEQNNYNNEDFNNQCDKYGYFTCLHGSDVCNFYSILQNGLKLPKETTAPGIFGSGIYLTSHLDVALNFAKSFTFEGGLLNNECVRMVAICKVIKHPTFVLRHKEENMFKNSIPKEYILVKNESVVKVTHLLVQLPCSVVELYYKVHENSLLRRNEGRYYNSLVCNIRQHWLIFIVIIYGIILILIRTISGRSVLFSNWDSSELLD